ncbi:hypothetical protein SF123566_9909 [Shigella flexneri 1235-66]|nr:hypothetical protein SF123566_9909 [Shigella flexneri 1235-66]
MLCDGLFFVRFGIFVVMQFKIIKNQQVILTCFSELFALLFEC